MSGFDPTTTELLAAIKRYSLQPDSNGLFTNAEYLSIATSILLKTMVPEVEKIRENYYIAPLDVTPVASQAEYIIPEHAAGGVLRNIWWIDTAGRGRPMVWQPIHMIDSRTNEAWRRGDGPYYVIEGDHAVLTPAPTNANGTIRFRFYQRPGKLVPTSEAAVITAIDRGTGVISCVEPGWTSGDDVDFIAGDRNFEHLARDINTTGLSSGASVTVATTDIPDALRPTASGDQRQRDYVALAGESPIVQLPLEMHSVLGRLAAADVLRADADLPNARDQEGLARAELEQVRRMLSPRTQGGRKAVNRSHPLNRGRRRRFR